MTPSPDDSAPRPDFPDNVARRLRSGELGRAREILASRVAQAGFDPELLEQLGMVLLQMGEHVEAGRHLFLSGRRRTDYRRSVEAFLDRYRRADLRQFLSQWPAAARRTRFRDLPPSVLAELTARGLPPTTDGSTTVAEYLGRHPTRRARVLRAGAILVILAGVATWLVVRARS